MDVAHSFHDDTQEEIHKSAEVGSNGEMKILEEDILQTEASRATGLVGKSSEVQ